ncbi:MAG: FliI/YscN family ATPase [Planctomycetota bacterium]|jgi:FliI/YscN family ATPase
MSFDSGSCMRALGDFTPAKITGEVVRVVGLVAHIRGIVAPVGSLLVIEHPEGPIEAEVIGFTEDNAIVMPFGTIRGVAPGASVRLVSSLQRVAVSSELLGRVVDGRGRPIDGKGQVADCEALPIYVPGPEPLERTLIREPLATGVRSIDGLMTCGKGQRVGLFSGSGVGKSVLLGMIARFTSAEVVVIALVGERGREVREFIERELGEEGMKRAVLVVATSEQSALTRVKAPFVATAIAEYFRDSGKDVLLLMDSITRMAYAQREIGLSAGEPPATKGYPPSVFSLFPRLLERAGNTERGSITGFYNVLVDADDITEPVADAVRGIIDGHVWLSRDLANRAHYPAVDPLQSVSRVMIEVADKEHRDFAGKVIGLLAAHRDAEDLINIGAYARGSNPEIDRAIVKMPLINKFLRQDLTESSTLEDAVAGLRIIVEGQRAAAPPPRQQEGAPGATPGPAGMPGIMPGVEQIVRPGAPTEKGTE